MHSFKEFLSEATKLWFGFEHLPSKSGMDKELYKFFQLLQKHYKNDSEFFYIEPKYDFKKANKALTIKITDPQLIKKVAASPYLSDYGFVPAGQNFKSSQKVKVILYPSGGMRGSGRLPKVGEEVTIPSTDQQEMGTILYFESAMKGKPMSVEEISKKVGYKFDENWYYSFQEQYNAFHSNMGSMKGAKIYLDSGTNDSNILINLARKLGLKDLKDNWNPADIWIMNISKSKIISDCKDMKTLAEFNAYLEAKFDSKEIVGVSLKKVSKGKRGKFEVVKATDLPEVDLAPAPTIFNPFAKNFIFMTQGTPSGFQIRTGYKAASVTDEGKIRIYLEGREKGSNVQLGAVSAKAFADLAKENGFDIEADKRKIFADPMAYLNKTLPRLLKNPNVQDNVGEFPVNDQIALKSGAFLTYYLDILLSSDVSILKDCYFSSLKKNEFSSVHCKVS